jgi:hypothetical protein
MVIDLVAERVHSDVQPTSGLAVTENDSQGFLPQILSCGRSGAGEPVFLRIERSKLVG